LLGGPFGPRDYLEPAVGDRLATLHGQAVCAFGEPSFGPFDGFELVGQSLGETFAELGFVEIRSDVGSLIRIGVFVRFPSSRVGEGAFESGALTREKLTGMLGVHTGKYEWAGAQSCSPPS